jgi:polyribonucleotide nucleotidyltransferase
VRDELKEGEQLLVKVINVDPSGKIRLSRKALLTEGGEGGGSTSSEPQPTGGGEGGERRRRR